MKVLILVFVCSILVGLASGATTEWGGKKFEQGVSNPQERELQASSSILVGNRRPRNGRKIRLGQSIIFGGSVIVDDPSSAALRGDLNDNLFSSQKLELRDPEYTIQVNPTNTSLGVETDLTVQTVYLEWKIGRDSWTSVKLEETSGNNNKNLPNFMTRIQLDRNGLLKWRLKVLQHNGKVSFTGVRKVRIMPRKWSRLPKGEQWTSSQISYFFLLEQRKTRLLFHHRLLTRLLHQVQDPRLLYRLHQLHLPGSNTIFS